MTPSRPSLRGAGSLLSASMLEEIRRWEALEATQEGPRSSQSKVADGSSEANLEAVKVSTIMQTLVLHSQ